MIYSILEVYSLKGKRESSIVNPVIDGLVLNSLDQLRLDNLNDIAINFEVARDPDFFLYGLQWFQLEKEADFDFVLRSAGKEHDARKKIIIRTFNGEEGESCLRVDLLAACLTKWKIEHREDSKLYASFRFTSAQKKVSAQKDWKPDSSIELYAAKDFGESVLEIEHVGLSGLRRQVKIEFFKCYEETFSVTPVLRSDTDGGGFIVDMVKSTDIHFSPLSVIVENSCIDSIESLGLETNRKRNVSKKFVIRWQGGFGKIKEIEFKESMLMTVRPLTHQGELGRFEILFAVTGSKVASSSELCPLQLISGESQLLIASDQLCEAHDCPELWEASLDVFSKGIDAPIDCISISPRVFPFSYNNKFDVDDSIDISFSVSLNALDSSKENHIVGLEAQSFFASLVSQPSLAFNALGGEISQIFDEVHRNRGRSSSSEGHGKEKPYAISFTLADGVKVVGLMQAAQVNIKGSRCDVRCSLLPLGLNTGEGAL